MSAKDPVGGNQALREVIERFWTTPERAEWIPKTDVVPHDDLTEWMASDDIEIVGFAFGMMGNARFRVEPPLSPEEYVGFVNGARPGGKFEMDPSPHDLGASGAEAPEEYEL